MRDIMIQKSEFFKMRDCSGFSQIGSHIFLDPIVCQMCVCFQACMQYLITPCVDPLGRNPERNQCNTALNKETSPLQHTLVGFQLQHTSGRFPLHQY